MSSPRTERRGLSQKDHAMLRRRVIGYIKYGMRLTDIVRATHLPEGRIKAIAARAKLTIARGRTYL